MRKNTGIEYGDIRKIARITGYSYDYVRRVLIYGSRRNDKISKAAETIVESNKILGLTK